MSVFSPQASDEKSTHRCSLIRSLTAARHSRDSLCRLIASAFPRQHCRFSNMDIFHDFVRPGRIYAFLGIVSFNRIVCLDTILRAV
jgi:hypothetical protein